MWDFCIITLLVWIACHKVNLNFVSFLSLYSRPKELKQGISLFHTHGIGLLVVVVLEVVNISFIFRMSSSCSLSISSESSGTSLRSGAG